MFKRMAALLLALLFLCGCSQQAAPTAPSTEPSSEPNLESTAESTGESTPEPSAEPDPLQQKIDAMLSPETQDALADNGFVFLRELAGQLMYLYTGSAAQIKVTPLNMSLTLPQELAEQVYVVVCFEGDGHHRVRVLDRTFVSLYCVYEYKDRLQWLAQQQEGLITGGEAWGIYLFEVRRFEKATLAQNEDWMMDEHILGQTPQFIYHYAAQQNDFGPDSTQDDMPRLTARKLLGEELYDAMGGNRTITKEEVQAMITIDENAP